jgi:ubiquinone/menaquinone biosynthesis C-methylase UbiE
VSRINAEAIEAWNGVLFDKFSRFRHVLTTGLSIHGTEALRRHRPPEGARVLDVGCGFGDTTVELAHLVGLRGSVMGVDAAVRFVEEARRSTRTIGIGNANFFTADAQIDDLNGPYDRVFSRFGTMFFASPVAALRNVRRSLAEGGSLLMVVWRRREDNPWTHVAERAVREILPPVEHSSTEPGDAPTCGPGPFSMADADSVSAQLLAAGYVDVSFERFDADISIGRNLKDALAFAMSLGPAGELIRLAAARGIDETARVEAALRQALAPFVRPDGVFAPSSTWFVRAHSS